LADYEGPMEQAITALKAALEQPEPWVKSYCGGKPNYTTPAEQEPVAWMHKKTGLLRREISRPKGVDWDTNYWEPLYTHPPRREWKGLSQEEIDRWTPEIHPVILAVEAELKEKNHE
jgi:hypothetical protein